MRIVAIAKTYLFASVGDVPHQVSLHDLEFCMLRLGRPADPFELVRHVDELVPVLHSVRRVDQKALRRVRSAMKLILTTDMDVRLNPLW